MARKILALLVLAATAVGLLGYHLATRELPVFVHEGVAGPAGRTVIVPARSAAWTDYSGGGDSRLSVLLTDPDSSWLGLAHGLKSAGIPFSITDDYREALRHKVILVYPRISGATLAPEALRALGAVPRNGGTLIGFNVLGGGLQTVFGFAKAVPSRARHRLTFAKGFSDDPNGPETVVPLGGAVDDAGPVGSYAYSEPRGTPIATYDDGSAAIIGRRIGDGRAYAVGVDIGALLLKGHNSRQVGMARSYVNDYEPMLDVLLRFVRRLYREGEDRAVFLRPVPDGEDLAVIISHDVDFTRSFANMLDYARLEQAAGIRATYFIQTKYLEDWNDDIILGETAPATLRQLRAMDMELASHSVSHSRVFNKFPLGDGHEAYPAYRPFVRSATTTHDGTILGELRVSKFLIETLSGGAPVVSFRPGHLSNPTALPQALAATEYRYSSTVTANNSLTHLPFRLTRDRGATVESPIFEFPVTIEDEIEPPLGERLPEALDLARRIAQHGGLFMIMIHTDILGHKLAFERDFIEAVRDFSWFGALDDYGPWWVARDAVQLDTEAVADRLVLRLIAPRRIRGLTLDVPAGLILDPDQPEMPPGTVMDGNRLIVGDLDGKAVIMLLRR